MGKPRKAPPAAPVEARIESLSHDGRGLTHVAGKTVFVQDALAGELVRFRYLRQARRYDEARCLDVLEAAPERVEPRCAHFGICGGCALQHLAAPAQIAFKQAALGEVLERIGRVAPERWLPPLVGELWGYRRKARLGVRDVARKGRVLVGFRERASSFIADLHRCEILHPSVGERLDELAATIGQLSLRDRVPQIEMAQGDGAAVLVLRVLEPPTPADLAVLAAFAERTDLHLYLQEGGLETIRPLPGQALELSYLLPGTSPDEDMRIVFAPSDFTQVNLSLNRLLVARALELLDPRPEERILDLFCGLGNFSLPLARHAGTVLGVEGDPGLVARARANAARNGLENVLFQCADLYRDATADSAPADWRTARFNKALIDPPRGGALPVLDGLANAGVERLVYVSCYPPTLARDAERLVHQLGYRLISAGAMDMFPHTAHAESIAVFER